MDDSAPAETTAQDCDPDVLLHVTLPGSRTLCAWELPEPDGTPRRVVATCGTCLLLASWVRFEAVVALERTQGVVEPAVPSAAWRQLVGTDWDDRLNLTQFLANADQIDARSTFDAVRFAVDPVGVQERVATFGQPASP